MELPQNKVIVLFDGVCNLCNNWVRFLIKRDMYDRFRFVAISSDKGKELMAKLSIEPSVDSIIVYHPKTSSYYYKSEAVIEIFSHLGWKYYWYKVLVVIPTSILNMFYDLVAKNRYSIYGKRTVCMLPSPGVKSKFL